MEFGTYLVRFTNHAKTIDPLFAQFKYASGENSADANTAMYGTPCFVHFVKIFGAFPATASEYRDRELIYKNEFPELHAEVIITALITLGSPEIPASTIPTTNADDLAPTPPFVNRASLKGAMMPMANTQPM